MTTNINDDNHEVFINGTIDNLIMNATYRAYIIIASRLEMQNMDKNMIETVYSKITKRVYALSLTFNCFRHIMQYVARPFHARWIKSETKAFVLRKHKTRLIL